MAAVDRIQKFLDDQLLVLTSGSKPVKVIAEIDKFRAWLVKHQNEVVPDASKGKIMTILEKYNRAQGNFADYRDAVVKIFSDFLQLPEGKLTNSKNKSKVLIWLQNLTDGNAGDESAQMEGTLSNSLTEWTIEGIDPEHSTVTLLSTTNSDEWKEDVPVRDPDLLARIQELLDQNNSSVIVFLGESEDQIVGIK